MTPDQLALKQLLDTTPIAWVTLTPDQRSLLRETLRPIGEFSPEQRDLLRRRYLPITENQLEAAQALLPDGVGIQAIADIDGALWLSADLLTDCMEPTDTYHGIAPILAMLPITLKSPDDFPAPTPLDF